MKEVNGNKRNSLVNAWEQEVQFWRDKAERNQALLVEVLNALSRIDQREAKRFNRKLERS